MVTPLRSTMNINGICEPKFHLVREVFEENFARRGEIGASVCLIHRGEVAVDLWGGLADRQQKIPWERNTLGVVFSCTKGAIALCTHLLLQRGQIELDAPLTLYWPEFAAQGKDSITVRLALSHQSGLPAIRTPLRPGGLYDWEYIVETLAQQSLFWEPGTRQGYQASTFGHLLGEVIRRVTNREVGTFFHDEIAGPLGLDFYLGLPESEELRVAPTIKPDPLPRGEKPWRFVTKAGEDPQSIQALTIRNTGRHGYEVDTREAHAAILPSQGGITHARGLAGMYAPAAMKGQWGSVRLFDAVSIARMQEVASASAVDATLLTGMRFSLGFVKSSDNRHAPAEGRDSIVLSSLAFGHPGMGGSVGFADPGGEFSFGYTMNKQGRGVLLNERGQALIDAVYHSLGYTNSEPCYWY